jgi:hypothetical protein
MQPPSDLSLPFFAYGIFKPGQLAFHQLKDLICKVEDSREVNGDLLIRDGLPILDRDGEGKVRGALLFFKQGDEAKAYDRIAKMEPGKQYTWDVISLGGNQANVLAGRSAKRGSTPFEGTEWDGRDDPLFTAALEVVEETLTANRGFELDLKPLFRLQMAYLLLWSAIERYLSLRYHLGGDVEAKVKHLAKEESFRTAVKRFARGPRDVVRADRPQDKETLDPASPEEALRYYYQVRCNATHRGKAVVRDHETVEKSLSELLTIFQLVLSEAFRTNQLEET